MKKGNVWPQVRARWARPSGPTFRQHAPTWLFNNATLGFIEDPFDPLTITQVTIDDGITPWQYVAPSGRLIWFREWVDGDFHGFIRWTTFTSNTDDTTHARLEVDFHYTSMVNPPYADLWAEDVQTPREWTQFQGPFTEFQGLRFRVNRWLSRWIHDVRVATYAEIRAAGEDPNDTEPLGWG